VDHDLVEVQAGTDLTSGFPQPRDHGGGKVEAPFPLAGTPRDLGAEPFDEALQFGTELVTLDMDAGAHQSPDPPGPLLVHTGQRARQHPAGDTPPSGVDGGDHPFRAHQRHGCAVGRMHRQRRPRDGCHGGIGRSAGTVTVSCRPASTSGHTIATVTYDLTALGEDGEGDLAELSGDYDGFLAGWEAAIAPLAPR
jgi:hypothetical protein